jgi:hypothetical protein
MRIDFSFKLIFLDEYQCNGDSFWYCDEISINRGVWVRQKFSIYRN